VTGPDARVKLLYIAGWSRSGTTILDKTVGQLPGFCSVGELHYLWSEGLLENGRCGCGVALCDCEFWQGVLDTAFGSEAVPAPAEVVGLQASTIRTRHLPRLWWERRSPHHSWPYGEILVRLYAAIAERSGARVIVDSSKFPADAFVASTLDGLDLYVVHAVRDPRAVAYSWARRRASEGKPGTELPRHGPVYSSLRWSVWNASIATLLHRTVGDRYMKVRYEDFVGRPRQVLEAVLALLGEPGLPLPLSGEHKVVLGTTHTAWGNDSRFASGEVELRADDEWRRRMGRSDRLLATVPAAPLMARYGYGLRP
jgi:hypothetical protein